MTKLPLLLVVVLISVIISCKKEVAETGDSELPQVASINSTTSDQLIASKTQFGAVYNFSTDKEITFLKKMGVNYVRARILVSNFDGNVGRLQTFSKNGIKVILNLNWKAVNRKNPNSFPQDMTAYRKKLGDVLDKYKPEVAVIENEPTNQLFYSGKMSDYITELKNAIDVCKQHGVKVADGCVHVGTVKDIMNGGPLSDAATRAKQLLDAYKTLDLNYVNVHEAGFGNSYPPQDLVKVAEYIRNYTGKPVISNEFSIHTNSTLLVRDMVQGFKQGNYIISLVYSANSTSGALPLTKGNSLNALGNAFVDSIQ